MTRLYEAIWSIILSQCECVSIRRSSSHTNNNNYSAAGNPTADRAIEDGWRTRCSLESAYSAYHVCVCVFVAAVRAAGEYGLNWFCHYRYTTRAHTHTHTREDTLSGPAVRVRVHIIITLGDVRKQFYISRRTSSAYAYAYTLFATSPPPLPPPLPRWADGS